MNQIPIHTVGRLVGDPARMYRRDGIAVTSVTVEVRERRLTPDGWRSAGTTHLVCRAWAGLAEHIYDSLGAGDRVVIVGRLRREDHRPDARSGRHDTASSQRMTTRRQVK